MKTHWQKKRCRFCGDWFRPVVNNGFHQECCPKRECRLRAAAARARRYRLSHRHLPEYKQAAARRQQGFRDRRRQRGATGPPAPEVPATGPASSAGVETQEWLRSVLFGLVMATHESIDRADVLAALNRYAEQGRVLHRAHALGESGENKVFMDDVRNVTLAPSERGF